jgi:hypothetical protein
MLQSVCQPHRRSAQIGGAANSSNDLRRYDKFVQNCTNPMFRLK